MNDSVKTQLLRFSRFMKHATMLLVLASVFAVGGCSTDDTEEGEAAEYPTLSTVPNDAGADDTVAEAKEIQEGLRADRENARYTDEALRADTTLGAPLAPPPGKEDEVQVVVEETKTEITSAQETTTVTETVTTITEEPSSTSSPTVAPAAAVVAVSSSSDAESEKATEIKQEATSAQTAAVAPTVATTVVSSQGVEKVFEEQLAVSSATSVVGFENATFNGEPTAPVETAGNSAVALQNPGEDGGRLITNYAASDGRTPIEIIFFEEGSNRIGRNDMSKLKKIAQTQLRSGGVLKVVGHASSRTRQLPLDEHKLVNLDASQRRATSVAQTFLDLGVAGDNLIIESVSDAIPLSVEAMPSEEAKNRRVEIFLLN
jgi:outer membrane protein OmpA-like peptidoglycan-associated protein